MRCGESCVLSLRVRRSDLPPQLRTYTDDALRCARLPIATPMDWRVDTTSSQILSAEIGYCLHNSARRVGGTGLRNRWSGAYSHRASHGSNRMATEGLKKGSAVRRRPLRQMLVTAPLDEAGDHVESAHRLVAGHDVARRANDDLAEVADDPSVARHLRIAGFDPPDGLRCRLVGGLPVPRHPGQEALGEGGANDDVELSAVDENLGAVGMGEGGRGWERMGGVGLEPCVSE